MQTFNFSLFSKAVQLALISSISFSVHATELFWDPIGSCSGDFNNADCWGGIGVPGTSDVATWNLDYSSPYTVSFNNFVSNQQARIREDDIFWQLNGNTYHLYNAAITPTQAGLQVGINSNEGQARLQILNGSVSSDLTVVGVGDDSVGHLFIGNSGTFSSTLTNTTGFLGNNIGSSGTVTVDGAGSTWSNSGDLHVGESGTGTLNINNGSSVSNAVGYLGFNPGSSGTATVDGAGSTWSNNSSLYIGGNVGAAGGTGTLNISNGGTIDVTDTLKVWNAGTVNLNGGSITAGSFDSTLGTFNFTDGALTVNGGTGTYADGNIDLVIDGTGVGDNPTLVLANGASANYSAGNAIIGEDGTGTLNITNGGAVTNTTGYMGMSTGGNGTVTVNGVGSNWINSSNLEIGLNGTGILNIQNGGTVAVGGYIGNGAGASTINLDGGILSVLGNIDIDKFNIGSVAGSSGNYTIGAGKTISATTVSVGKFGTGNLNINNGGMISISSDSFVGEKNGSIGTATIDGAGSNLTNTFDFTVGGGGGGTGTLNILNGGTVSSLRGYLGRGVGSSGTATVDGVGSVWSISNTLRVGENGNGILNIQNGGTITSLSGGVGSGYTSIGTVTVDGAGSTWANNFTLSVGKGGTGILNIQNGGTVTSSNVFLGDGTGSIGTSTVDGADSNWMNNTDFYVGWNGTGILNIHNGGTVTSTTGYVGRLDSGNGTVNIDGVGSNWTTSGSLYLGGYSNAPTGGNGTLNVQTGGALDVGATLKVWSSSTINLTNGTINANDLNNDGTITGSGAITTASGLTNQGTMAFTDTTDVSGAVTNDTSGSILISGGTTTFNNDVVHNGAQFQVVDGSQAVFSESYSGEGDFAGTGELVFAGNLLPGNSPALIDVEGDMTLLSTATTTMELSGLLRGDEYDAFDVGGELALGGELDVVLYGLGDLFNPSLGDEFDLFSAETLIGEFDILSYANLDSGLDWQLDYLFDENGTTDIIRLSVVSAVPIPSAVLLFGSGLIGLIGLARRKAA